MTSPRPPGVSDLMEIHAATTRAAACIALRQYKNASIQMKIVLDRAAVLLEAFEARE